MSTPAMIPLTSHVALFTGAVNVGVIRDGQQALLIDCGDGGVAEVLRQDGVRVERALFTHHHRDQACGAAALAGAGAALVVPAEEYAWFAEVERYWDDPAYRWHWYNCHPQHLMLATSLPVADVVTEGEEIVWHGVRITVLRTPGHTDGSVTYLVEDEGQRIAFTGDLIYDTGQIWDGYSLQKALPVTTDYHGFLHAMDEVADSLQRVCASQPTVLAPSHGRVMRDPQRAVAALIERLQTCYDQYARVSALRWYFPDCFTPYLVAPAMPIRPGVPPPSCLHYLATTWLLRSETGAALVMDCGSDDVVRTLQEWLAAGEITAIDALWVTHYHDDHVDGIPAFQQAFSAPLIADSMLADVLEHPTAWRLPCQSPDAVHVDRRTAHGERWQWHEYTITAYHFPGQTLYHGGLLVEGNGLRLFFTGDSFTPAGLDDYCALNRNLLGEGQGMDACLQLIAALQPVTLFNAHVDVAFTFTDAEIATLRANLRARTAMFRALFPWEDANFGLDESWARCYPYEQQVAAGEQATFTATVTNHAERPVTLAARPVLPDGWGVLEGGEVIVSAHVDGGVPFTVHVPAHSAAGRYVIPVDLTLGDRRLPQFTEAILVVE